MQAATDKPPPDATAVPANTPADDATASLAAGQPEPERGDSLHSEVAAPLALAHAQNTNETTTDAAAAELAPLPVETNEPPEEQAASAPKAPQARCFFFMRFLSSEAIRVAGKTYERPAPLGSVVAQKAEGPHGPRHPAWRE